MITPPHQLTDNQRVMWIDALRGFTMFFVVFNHISAISIGIHPFDSIIGNALVSFRMPMFFFISGFIAYKSWEYWTNEHFIERIRTKARVQLIPTIVFFSFSVLFGGGNPFQTYVNDGLGGFWFTLVLFEFFVVYFSLSYINHAFKGRGFNISAIAIGLLGIVMLVLFRRENLLWTTLCLTPFFRYIQFFMFGLLCRKYQTKLFALLKKDWFITANLVLFFISVALICNSNDIKSEYGFLGNFIHDILVRYTGLFIVLCCFYKGKDHFEKNTFSTRALSLLGRRSLDIYMLHNFLLPQLPFLKPLLENKFNLVIEFWVITLITIAVVVSAVAIGNILRNSHYLAYWLLGAKKFKEPVVATEKG